jgi:translation elongation factor EF-Ts
MDDKISEMMTKSYMQNLPEEIKNKIVEDFLRNCINDSIVRTQINNYIADRIKTIVEKEVDAKSLEITTLARKMVEEELASRNIISRTFQKAFIKSFARSIDGP